MPTPAAAHPRPSAPVGAGVWRLLRWLQGLSFALALLAGAGWWATRGGWSPDLSGLAGLADGGQSARGLEGSLAESRPDWRATAPEFELALFDGGTLRLADLRGQGVVLNFWASWCAPCRTEAPVFNRVAAAVRERGVLFVGVDVQDAESEARAFLAEFGTSYPNGPDRDMRIATDFGVAGLPTTIFLDPQVRIARRWVGPLGEPQLEAFVREIQP